MSRHLYFLSAAIAALIAPLSNASAQTAAPQAGDATLNSKSDGINDYAALPGADEITLFSSIIDPFHGDIDAFRGDIDAFAGGARFDISF